MAGASNAITGPQILSGASTGALVVGANGATNPAFNVNTNTASVATGINITGAAEGAAVAVSVLSSGTNEALTIDAKGSGTITLGGTSTGNIVATRLLTQSAGQRMTGFTTDVSAATIALTAAQSGGVFMATKGSATQTYTLPAVAAGLVYTFVCGHASGEILVNSTGSLTFQIKASEGGASVVTAAGTGIKNTAATNVVGDHITLVCDGTNWIGINQSGTWASQ